MNHLIKNEIKRRNNSNIFYKRCNTKKVMSKDNNTQTFKKENNYYFKMKKSKIICEEASNVMHYYRLTMNY